MFDYVDDFESELEDALNNLSIKKVYIIRKLSHKVISKNNERKKSITSITENPSDFDIKIAEAMAKTIEKLYPIKHIQDKTIKIWSNDIRKIRTIDKYDESTIANVLVFVYNSKFWRKNILSAHALRKNMPMLIAQSIESQSKESLI